MTESTTRQTPERKVLGDLGNTKSEPVSPTANLRLLTSLASNLKSAVDSSCQTKKIHDRTPIIENAESLKLLPRKQKSLGLLCDKFLSLYPLVQPEDCEPPVISLDGTAKTLGTEKRRIYDIINVLESLEMAKKAGKNRYFWHGQNSLITTLVKFKSLAIKSGLEEQIQEIQRMKKAYTGDYGQDSPGTSMIYKDEMDEEPYNESGIREEKSLGAMCQKFVMLFLVSLKNGVINLDIAAKVLITDIDNRASGSGDRNVGSRFKTKVRRLYDIANVLTAIGLIKKVYMYDRTIRKPVFKYIGPDVQYVDLDRATPVREHYNSLTSMMTPSKSCGFGSRRISTTICTTTRCYESPTNNTAVTPVTHKRRPLKRKLLVGESSFGRTHSSPCLDTVNRSNERLDDSILRVAEMELEKLNSTLESTPKVCTNLLSRYNSDSCITIGNRSSIVDNRESTNTAGSVAREDRGSLTVANVPFIVVSNENFCASHNNVTPKTCQRTNSTVATPVQISGLNSLTPVRNYGGIAAMRYAPSTSMSVPLLKTIVPRKLVPTTSSASAIEGKKYSRITHYKIEPPSKNPKIINLTKFDPKKLIPIKRSDIKISLTPVNPIVVDATSSPGFAILTRIPTPIVSPGDTFKAVKIGNTLQLVPMNNDDCAIKYNPDNRGNNGNGS